MELSFASQKLAKTCNSAQKMQKEWGADNAKRLKRRLAQLQAAATLADLATLPQGRPHPLAGDLKGLWALDLQHPLRLLFKVANDPCPMLADGGVDCRRVTAVCIERIEDYHGN